MDRHVLSSSVLSIGSVLGFASVNQMYKTVPIQTLLTAIYRRKYILYVDLKQ